MLFRSYCPRFWIIPEAFGEYTVYTSFSLEDYINWICCFELRPSCFSAGFVYDVGDMVLFMSLSSWVNFTPLVSLVWMLLQGNLVKFILFHRHLVSADLNRHTQIPTDTSLAASVVSCDTTFSPLCRPAESRLFPVIHFGNWCSDLKLNVCCVINHFGKLCKRLI